MSAVREVETLSGPHYPLQGLRVIEFCWVWAGPFLGQFLADLGAEVIKIEWYDRYDLYRTRGVERLRGKVPETVHREMSASFHSLNRNKVGFAVNLKEPDGVDLIRQLAARSEVVIENWSAGTLERLGVGYAALKAANPDLLMLSLPAFGPNSRLKDMRSYGLVTSSLAGAEAPIRADGEFVGTPTFNISDPNAALFGLLGVLAGLLKARQCGAGLNLVVAQLEAAMTVMNQGVARPREDQIEGLFETADGRFMAVCLPRATAAEAGPDSAALAAWCAGLSGTALAAAAQARGGSAVEACNVVDSADHPTFADLGVRVGSDHPVTGREDLIAAPWRINGQRAPVRKPAPVMAEGNTYVLRQILGLSDDAIADLRVRKIV